MTSHDNMTEMARALRPRSAAPFHKDAPWYRIACVGGKQLRGREFVRGGAD